MRRFTHILFSPLGDNDNPAAIRRVADLAHQNGAKLTLFGTVPESSRRHRLLHTSEFDAAIESAERIHMAERLEHWKELTDGADVEIDVRAGNAALTVRRPRGRSISARVRRAQWCRHWSATTASTCS